MCGSHTGGQRFFLRCKQRQRCVQRTLCRLSRDRHGGSSEVCRCRSLGAAIAKGMDTLYTHAIGGFNAMPAKGLCMTCSDDEVKAAVDHMIENSK